MANKCIECGHIFDDCELARWEEDRGEFWGVRCTETMIGCPICHGEYEETTPCEICGSEHLDDELFGGVCEECIDEYRKDFDSCYEISLGEKEEIKINSLLASLFEPSDIEAILIKHIKTNCPDIDCSKYIDNDISWFGEQIVKEVSKNENAKG
jgi:hypothetical protein